MKTLTPSEISSLQRNLHCDSRTAGAAECRSAAVIARRHADSLRGKSGTQSAMLWQYESDERALMAAAQRLDPMVLVNDPIHRS